MTDSNQPAPLVFSTAFGLLMVAAAAVHAGRPGYAAAAIAVLSVLIGLRYRAAATLAVMLTVAVAVLSEPPQLFVALSGLSAAAYLVMRHAEGIVTTTRPTVIGMVGFALVGVVATMTPLSVPWLPLVAPPAVVVIFALAMMPFVRGRHRRPPDEGDLSAG